MGAGKISTIGSMVTKVAPDALGGVELQAADAAGIARFGVGIRVGRAADGQRNAGTIGALLIGDARLRKWKPNESFFLQAVGDQLVLSVNHTRLRSLVRSLAGGGREDGIAEPRSVY